MNNILINKKEYINFIVSNFNYDFLKDLRNTIDIKLNGMQKEIEDIVLNNIDIQLRKYSKLKYTNVKSVLWRKLRLRELVIARQHYFWYVYFRTNKTTNELADVTGKNHSTILYSLRTYYNGVQLKFKEQSEYEYLMDLQGVKFNGIHPNKVNTWITTSGSNPNYELLTIDF